MLWTLQKTSRWDIPWPRQSLNMWNQRHTPKHTWHKCRQSWKRNLPWWQYSNRPSKHTMKPTTPRISRSNNNFHQTTPHPQSIYKHSSSTSRSIHSRNINSHPKGGNDTVKGRTAQIEATLDGTRVDNSPFKKGGQVTGGMGQPGKNTGFYGVKIAYGPTPTRKQQKPKGNPGGSYSNTTKQKKSPILIFLRLRYLPQRKEMPP